MDMPTRLRRRPGLCRAAGLGLLLVLVAGCTDSTSSPPTEPLTVSPASATLLPGETLQLVAQGRSSDVAWSSSDPGVATVVPITGFVTAVAPGEAVIRVESGGRTASATVRVLEPARIRLEATSADFEALDRGPDPAPRTLAVTNDGEQELTGLAVESVTYGAGEAPGWLTASLDGSTAPATLTLSASRAGLAPGTYTATVAVGSPVATNSPRTVAVTFTVRRGAEIVLSTAQVELSAEPGAPSAPATVQITNPGDEPLTGLEVLVAYPGGGPTDWLGATLSSATAPSTLTLQGDGLPPGSYVAAVEVRSAIEGVEPRIVEVSYLVTRVAALGLSRTEVAFVAEEGGADPASETVQVTNAGSGTLDDLQMEGVSYVGGPTGGWLTATLSGASAPATLTLAADVSGLPAGSYAATVTLSSSVAVNSPRTVSVTLDVQGIPAIQLSTTRLDFRAVRGGSDPPSQAVEVINGGGGTLTGLQGQILYQGAGGWLAGGFTSGSAPSVMVIEASPGTLPAGEYRAVVRVSSSTDGRVAPRDVEVVFQVDHSFALDVFPLFNTSYSGFPTPCTNCHFNGGTAPRLDEVTAAYQALLNGVLVVPGDPDASELVCRLEGSACGSAMPLPSQQIAIIRAWIEEGAAR